MDRAEAEARMREVQRIMERTTLYTLLPGAASVIGGLLVLAGCAVSYAMIRSLDFAQVLRLPMNAQWAFCLMWTAIGVVAIAQEVILTTHAARTQGLSPMARPARFAAFSLSPSLFVAVILTFQFLNELHVQYIVPVWMMCYGAGIYTAGLFSVRLPRLLGIAFLLLGAIALLEFPHYGVVSAALSFGLLHIAFGLAVIIRSRRSAEA